MFRSEVKINTICTYALPCLLGTVDYMVVGLLSAKWTVWQTSVGLAGPPAVRDMFGLGALLLIKPVALLQGQKGNTRSSVQGPRTAKTSGIISKMLGFL